MNLDELVREISSLGIRDREERLAEIFEEMEEEYGPDVADTEFDKLNTMLDSSRESFSLAFEKILNKGLNIKSKLNRSISRSKASKERLDENVRITSTKGVGKLDEIERSLEELENSINLVKDNSPEALIPSDEIILHNVEVLLDKIDEVKSYAISGAVTTKQIKIDNYLGALPLSSSKNREMLYKYWETISEKYDDVMSALDEVIGGSVQYGDDSEEIEEDIIEALKPFANKDLSYVSEFEPVQVKISGSNRGGDIEEPAAQLLSYVLSLYTLYQLDEDKRIMEGKQSGEIHGDTNALLAEEMRQSFGSSGVSGEGFSMLDPSMTDSPEDDELEQEFEGMLQDLDPLLAYYYNSPNSDGTQKVIALTKKGFENIQNQMDSILGVLGASDDFQGLELMVGSRIKNDIKNIKDTFNIRDMPFFLPTTIEYGELKAKNPSDIGEIMDFLSAVGDLLWEIPPMIPSKSVSRNFTDDTSEAPVVEGHSGMSKEGRAAIRKLVQAINDYYITPSYSGKLPIAEVDFVNSYGARKIISGAKNVGASSMEGTAYEKLIESKYVVTKSAIDKIYDYLNSIISGAELTYALTKKGEDAAQALTKIFDYEKENNNHMAAILKYAYDETGQEIGDKKFAGRTIEQREKDYLTARGEGKPSPLFILPAYLMKHKGIIETTGMKRSVAKLKDLLRRAESLPVILKSLLKAHDIVREIKGLEPVYAFRPLTITHSEEVINKMYLEFGVDLSHSEIDKMVTEVNSFSNIAKSLGVSEEIVYQVKAQFR